MNSLHTLHSRFLRERKFISNLSPMTIRFLTQSWNAFGRAMPSIMSPTQLNPDVLGDFIFAIRESGAVKPVTCNTYSRGVNCFLPSSSLPCRDHQSLVWLYFGFPLSFRDVEEMLAMRGVSLTYETIREWTFKFGQTYPNGLRRRSTRPRPPMAPRRRVSQSIS
jgi:hypothetical protein